MDFDYDDDDFVLPPRLEDSLLSAPHRPSNTSALDDLTGGRPTSPIQIDEEVVVKNKRKPQVKLIDRLLSDRGLKHLQRDAPRKLKFKGKGHEKQDLTTLLNYYQLWMHDVFPKANFHDCIAMTEKVGHITQLRIMRKQWIENTKPKPREEDAEDVEGLEVLRSIEQDRNGTDMVRTEEDPVMEVEKEDEPLFVDDMSDFDMDDIMGSQEPVKPKEVAETTKPAGSTAERDEFEDEMDAMNDLGDLF